MAFIREVVQQNIPIWDMCLQSYFIKGMQTGALDPELFREYMIQDSIYLKHYARVYGMAIYHCERLEEIQQFYAALSFVTDKESAVRLKYLKQYGFTDSDIEIVEPLPETQKYIEFLLQTAKQDNLCGILMAILPCMLSYAYIFRKAAVSPETQQSIYTDFIQDYAEAAYWESCKNLCAFAEKRCSRQPVKEKQRIADIFYQASLLELEFWEMPIRQAQSKTKKK